MMLVLFVVVQFVLWAHAAQVVQLAASDGNRAARVMGGGVAAGRSKAMAVLSGSGSTVTSPSIVVSLRTADVVQTTVSGWAVSVVPWLRLPVSATQVGSIQKFRMSG
jgi:hypothetical protein